MSVKKIIFFLIAGSICISLLGGVWYISNQKKEKVSVPASIKIWINEGTSESYKSIIEGFKKYAPEYSKTDIIIEKQNNDPEKYRTLLLSTISDGSGPDIFMVHDGEDAILDTKIEPIPGDLISITDFDKRYDEIFQGLITNLRSGKDIKSYLKGVPLGYESLGVFYNKSILREVPKTWGELENLYRETNAIFYPSNLGLGPIYTPNMIDIIPLWFRQAGATDYTDVSAGKNGLQDYIEYGKIDISNHPSTETESSFVGNKTLQSERAGLLGKRQSTLDMFMSGDIALIVGYPSLIIELEKSSKRVGSDSKGVILLTEKIPRFENKLQKNIGKYSYFAISKLSKNGIASAKFLNYLMTQEAEQFYIKEYPYIIPAQSEFYKSVEGQALSDNYIRTKLGAFIPEIGESSTIFNYGLKSRFERYLREGLDQTENPDIEDISHKISHDISCEINSSLGIENPGSCSEGQ